MSHWNILEFEYKYLALGDNNEVVKYSIFYFICRSTCNAIKLLLIASFLPTTLSIDNDVDTSFPQQSIQFTNFINSSFAEMSKFLISVTIFKILIVIFAFIHMILIILVIIITMKNHVERRNEEEERSEKLSRVLSTRL